MGRAGEPSWIQQWPMSSGEMQEVVKEGEGGPGGSYSPVEQVEQ